MSSTVLYLVRHGAIFSVRGKAYIGQVEAPLSEEGIEQAWSLRKWLEPVSFNLVCCSDLSRSHRTAKIIAGNRVRSIEVIPSIREISLGDWDGYSFKEIGQQYPEEYAARGRDLENWRPPGGESFADCRARVLPTLRKILDGTEGNVLMVGHAGVNRMILCDALGIPISNLFSIGQDYGCLNILEYGPSKVQLRLLNYVPLNTRPVTEIRPALTKRTPAKEVRRQ